MTMPRDRYLSEDDHLSLTGTARDPRESGGAFLPAIAFPAQFIMEMIDFEPSPGQVLQTVRGGDESDFRSTPLGPSHQRHSQIIQLRVYFTAPREEKAIYSGGGKRALFLEMK